MTSRRNVLAALFATAPIALFGLRAEAASPKTTNYAGAIPITNRNDGLAAIERRHGGRLGAAILDTGNQQMLAQRGSDRFALNSTYKVLAAAGLLARVDAGDETLDQRVAYHRSQLQDYSPVTSQHVGGDGMTLRAIAAAAVESNDNTAGNLLLDNLGGPKALTSWLRVLGDHTTRVDRREPTINDVAPGDPRDTTTPIAMADTLQRLLFADALTPASRQQLRDWMVACKTGSHRLRAAVPSNWTAGDKTGTGPGNQTNDVAVFWPPDRAPLIVTAYYNGSPAAEPMRSAVLAEVGMLAVALAGARPSTD